MSIYNISKFHTSCENAEDLSFPMMYHIMVYTLYYNCANPFNNGNLVSIVTHKFPPKWFPWQTK